MQWCTRYLCINKSWTTKTSWTKLLDCCRISIQCRVSCYRLITGDQHLQSTDFLRSGATGAFVGVAALGLIAVLVIVCRYLQRRADGRPLGKGRKFMPRVFHSFTSSWNAPYATNHQESALPLFSMNPFRTPNGVKECRSPAAVHHQVSSKHQVTTENINLILSCEYYINVSTPGDGDMGCFTKEF